ncbi:amino acid adenylation enzyme/thioester reductase family protein [Pseudomonas asplenii]|uniref:Amino acid adenylation enzyme/thioester reductase family protein n=5 Tax=Pseudomonas asplenii TaxID=53407 RepID=A0A0N0E1W7_9PSED|nr:non-ribosomal peptide synthetase [Pseudomonas fuscovaginae]KPA88169.1 amino acid adenylation enzyme/thioester reductase family protein [Pseudomonas fuscovaginae]
MERFFSPAAAEAARPASVPYPLTAAQQDIWLDQSSRGDSPLYNIGGYVELRGAVDPSLLRSAIEFLVQRHDALRTVLQPGTDGLPQQRFVERLEVRVPLYCFADHAEPLAAALERVEQEMAQVYPLDGSPLFRFFLMRLSDDHYLLGTQAHHLILDGWGFGQMLADLGRIYSALVRGEEVADAAASYVDFIEEDRLYQASPRYLRDRDYWLDKYRTLPEPMLLPRHRERPLAGTPPGDSVVQAFPTALHERMQNLAKVCQASTFHVWLAALYLCFTRSHQRDEWVVGLPILNRSHARFKATVGLFAQVSPTRLAFPDDTPFGELVRGIGQVLRQDLRHQRFPLSELNRGLGLLREDRAQLFEVSVSYEQDDHDYRYGQVPAHTVKVSNRHESMPLAIHLRSNRFNDRVWMHCVYDAAYFEAGEVEALAARVIHVLEQGLANARLPLAAFSLLAPQEAGRLAQWNDSVADYRHDVTLHRRIEEQAAARPEAVAAVHQGRSLSYAELNRRANALAAHLQELGVRPDDRVAIVARRGLETLVALLAILKSGAAYVPVDPSHPDERLRYLLDDSAPVAVLAQRELLARLSPSSVPLIELDSQRWHAGSDANPQVTGLGAQHLAYVIYTSGSTGLPKGVMVEHRTLSNLVDWHNRAFDLGRHSHVSSLAGFGFDAMAWEIWPTLCAGATLHLAPVSAGAEDLDALLAWWCAQPLDISFLPTPVAEYAFSRELDHPTLRTLLIGGDRLRQFSQARRFAVVNNYGPTETTVVATSGALSPGRVLPIGRPVANTRIYLLDEQRRLLPIGATGELYIGGAGVARGYLNRAELTAERFLDDPYSDEPGARMYRTGDLARWHQDGSLEYLGRNDDQVKIRGVRVELGEIEAAVASHPAVREAVVQLRDGRLLAWFIADRALPAQTLHGHLQGQLPGHLLPSAYVQLHAWPLTANGKLDRRALPAPDSEALVSREYQAPEGAVEGTLALIWAELLQVERVGRQDHFFELGGNSLLAVALVERMRQAGLQADVQVLFGQPTLAALAASVTARQAVEVPANRVAADCQSLTPSMLALVELQQEVIDRIVAGVPGHAANVQEIYPLAPLQEGLLYHHMTATAGDPYQQYALFAFDDRQRLEAFAQALQAVIARHDILRTSLAWEGLEQPMQVVWREARLAVEMPQLAAEGGDVGAQLLARFDPVQRPLDIRQAPLMALACAEDAANGRWVGLLRFHHLINDATSTAVLLAEINAHMRGHEHQLAPSVPYRNYVAQVRQDERQAGHEAFFRELLGDVEEPTLAFGMQRRQGDSQDHERLEQALDGELARRLRGVARQLGVSAASLYHLAWAQVLGGLSGRDDVVFGTVLLGRLQAGAGADRALGMFINTLPLRINLGGKSVVDALRHTHQRLTELLAHEHAPLALAQRCSAVPATTPLFNSLLNYRHTAAAPVGAVHTGVELLDSAQIVSHLVMLSIDDLGEDYRLAATALRSLGAQRVLDYLETALEGLVETLARAPGTALDRLPILPLAERRYLLDELNATQAEHPLEQCIQALFEQQVRRTPDAVALVAGERQLTYRELNERANQLACHLREQGVRPDTRVAICVERGPELVIGLWAIVKAGGVYLPLDPGYPLERLVYMLQDSSAVAVLVHQATRDLLGSVTLPLVDFDRNTWHDRPVSDPVIADLGPSNLAYVIYTSGSTGTPKGVALEHRGLCNLMHWSSKLCPDMGNSGLLQKAPFSFDGSIWEFFWPLTVGMRLVLARPDGHRDPDYLVRLVREQRIRVIKFVPAMLQQFLEQGEVSQCTSLTDVFCGGGELTAALAQAVQAKLPQVRLHNVYGPTEATVDSTAWTLEPGAPVPALQLPIGRPICNTRVYVLDAHDRPVPLGVSGQLHIGGVGVARGYLGLAKLTAERFIDSPFVAGDRLYRTGDLVRYRADGNLEFLGRDDFQVKLHGLRLELGEIEAALLSHEALREVAVLMRDERLVAYFTARVAGQVPTIEALRGYLLGLLPDYMVPSAYVQLDVLPLSPNGKLDRRALPAPGQDAVISRDYEAPRGPVEIALAEIWAEVLKIERVGRNDHFFELGGHSLLAVSLVARMRQAGLNADAREVFSQPTLAALAAKSVGRVQQVQVPATTIPTLNRKRRL